MCRAISFFSKSNDAQFESGAIQDTRILTGSAFDAPCARSEIAATSPINQDRTSPICPSHAGPAETYHSDFFGNAATATTAVMLSGTSVSVPTPMRRCHDDREAEKDRIHAILLRSVA